METASAVLSEKPTLAALSENVPVHVEAYRPAGVFISYASEDHDIAQAVYLACCRFG